MAAPQHDLGGREAGPRLQQVHEVRGVVVPHPGGGRAHLHPGICHEVSSQTFAVLKPYYNIYMFQELVSTSRQLPRDKTLCAQKATHQRCARG